MEDCWGENRGCSRGTVWRLVCSEETGYKCKRFKRKPTPVCKRFSGYYNRPYMTLITPYITISWDKSKFDKFRQIYTNFLYTCVRIYKLCQIYTIFYNNIQFMSVIWYFLHILTIPTKQLQIITNIYQYLQKITKLPNNSHYLLPFSTIPKYSLPSDTNPYYLTNFYKIQ